MDIEKRIDELLSKMTIEEKVGQLTQVFIYSDNADKIKEEVKKGRVGSLILALSAHAGNDPQELMAYENLNKIQRIAVEQSPNGIPLMNGRDVIHGHKTVFPIPLGMAAAFDSELVEKSYRAIAEEAACDGIHWSFAPMLDLSRDPRWGRIIESPGEDPYVGACVAKAVVKGFQTDDLSSETSIAACAKHYIGYGASEGGRDYHKAEISDYALRNYYLKSFKGAVSAGVATVMSSFNEVAGQAVSSSKYLMSDILRGELGFDGFVVSDWFAIEQLIKQGVCVDRKDCAKSALNAGVDMDMVDNCYIDYLEELVNKGEVSTETLDEAVRRVLRIKFRCGLFDHSYTEKLTYNKEEHLKIAYEMSAESIVLLKNEDNILPLDKNAKVGVVGPFANDRRAPMGSWMLDGIVEDTVTLVEGMKKAAPDAEILSTTSVLHDEMMFTVRRADVVVLALGESNTVTGEARSLSNIELSDDQKALIMRMKNLGKPVIGVISCGRPIAMQSIEPLLDGIIYSWHAGTQFGAAVGDILFGNYNPNGKLPVTLPRVTGQIPLYYGHPSSGRDCNGYYGEENNFNYEDCFGTPVYEFGYGLSYTDFAITDIKTDENKMKLEDIENGKVFKISVNVKNCGIYDGKEVVQCYVNDVISSMTRPVRELCGFEKVFVKNDEEKEVSFEIGKNALGFYNREGNFTVEKGTFEIFIGNSCYATEKIEIEVI